MKMKTKFISYPIWDDHLTKKFTTGTGFLKIFEQVFFKQNKIKFTDQPPVVRIRELSAKEKFCAY